MDVADHRRGGPACSLTDDRKNFPGLPYPGTVAGAPLYPGMSPATPPPPPPGGGGGLDTGATGAGDQYNGSVEAAQLTDEKLAEMLKQIFAANQGARDKVSAILTEIQNKQKQIAPEMGDPASVAAFGQFLDQKFAEIQKVLTDAQVDAKTQAAILDALGDEYRNSGPDAPGGGDNAGGNGSGGGGDGSGGGGDTSAAGGAEVAGGGAAPADPAAGQEPLMDPLAGMGLGGPMGMDPLSALGSALAGLPQAMGGGWGGAPLDGGPALSSLGACGFG